MLTCTTQLLEQDLTIIGPVKAVLYGTSTARDTDWVVRLCDVWPDGRSMSVCDGILRARYRNSLERPELMVPGQIYRFEVDLGSTAQVFKAGHCLQVEVTSSDFPATNTVFQNQEHPSHIMLPIMNYALTLKLCPEGNVRLDNGNSIN